MNIKVMLFICFFWCSALYSAEKNIYSLAMILDASEELDNCPVTEAFTVALCQQASPIIVTEYTVALSLQLQSSNESTKATLLAQKKESFFSDETWDFYKTTEGNLYLLIPKKYSEEKLAVVTASFKEAAKKYSYEPEEIALGFTIAPHSKVMRKVQSKELAKEVTLVKEKFINTDLLKRMFVQGQDDIFGMWHIYLGGHGNFAMKSDINQLLEKQVADAVDTSAARIAYLTIDQFRSLIQFFIMQEKVNFFYYMSCFAGGYNTIAPFVSQVVYDKEVLGALAEHETRQPTLKVISGLKPDSAGYQRQKYQKPNFTLVASGLTDTVVNDATFFYLQCQKEPNSDYLNFALFFDLLKKHTTSDKMVTKFNDTELRDILAALATRNKKVNFGYVNYSLRVENIPLVWRLGQEKFAPFVLNDQIFILSNAKVKAAELEKKSLSLEIKRDKKNDVILVSPLEIPIKIILRQDGDDTKALDIVSLIPGIGLHRFNDIEAELTVEGFLKSFVQTGSIFSKYFFIKKLKIIYGPHADNSDDWGTELELFNVLLRLKDTLDSEQHAIKKTLYIMFSGKNGQVFYNQIVQEEENFKFISSDSIDLQMHFAANASDDNEEKEFPHMLSQYFLQKPGNAEYSSEKLQKLFDLSTLKRFLSKKEAIQLERLA